MALTALFMVGALGACQPYVGGPCTYGEPYAATLTIEGQSDAFFMTTFATDQRLRPRDGWLVEGPLRFDPDQLPQGAKVGDIIPVAVTTITKGTCNPVYWDFDGNR